MVSVRPSVRQNRLLRKNKNMLQIYMGPGGSLNSQNFYLLFTHWRKDFKFWSGSTSYINSAAANGCLQANLIFHRSLYLIHNLKELELVEFLAWIENAFQDFCRKMFFLQNLLMIFWYWSSPKHKPKHKLERDSLFLVMVSVSPSVPTLILNLCKQL